MKTPPFYIFILCVAVLLLGSLSLSQHFEIHGLKHPGPKHALQDEMDATFKELGKGTPIQTLDLRSRELIAESKRLDANQSTDPVRELSQRIRMLEDALKEVVTTINQNDQLLEYQISALKNAPSQAVQPAQDNPKSPSLH